MDCDLYASTQAALDFFFRNELLVVGSVLGYDDWWVLPCGSGNAHLHPLDVGEGRAHREAALKWGVTFECIAGPCFDHSAAGAGAAAEGVDGANGCGAWLRDSAWGVLFRVVSIDAHQGTAKSIGSSGGIVSHRGGAGNGTGVGVEALSSPPRHGFTMRPAAVEAFRAHNTNCLSIRADGQV